jgi:predicted permease
LLIESLVLAGVGGAIGVSMAYAAVTALSRFGPPDLPRLASISVDRTVLAYALAATIASALLFGLAPALRLATAGVGDTLKEGGRSVAGSSHQRVRRVLTAVQLALAFVLVVSSGLLLRSFVAVVTTNPGFEPDGAITATIELPGARYDREASAAFYARATERVGALPGVAAAAFASDLPWTGYDENTGFATIGRPERDNDDTEARYHFITPGTLRATGVPLVAGRDLAATDTKESPPVILINESAARKYWKSAQGAVGARVNLWGVERTVAGVVGDVRDMPWHERAEPSLYFPVAQMWYPQTMVLVARTNVDPASTVDSIRRALQQLDPELPLSNIRPLAAVAGAAMATRRLTLWLVGVFGLTALVLAVVGIYGVMAQAVGQRAHEFGVRQALGATSADIIRLVFSSAAIMTLAGLFTGVALGTRFNPPVRIVVVRRHGPRSVHLCQRRPIARCRCCRRRISAGATGRPNRRSGSTADECVTSKRVPGVPRRASRARVPRVPRVQMPGTALPVLPSRPVARSVGRVTTLA